MRNINNFIPSDEVRQATDEILARDISMNEKHVLIFRLWTKAMNPPEPKSGPCVYIFRMGDVYKIGFTVNLSKRLRELDTPQLPYPTELTHVIYGSQKIENQLHKRFSERRLRGEWFALSPDDVTYIKSMDGV